MKNIPLMIEKHSSFLGCTLIFAVISLLFITGAPMGGAFSFSDSARHALNGAFIMDLFRDAPFSDPVGYAYDYYSQYPALTILFYPPLFSFILAPFYAVFGVSQETALLTVFTCYCSFAFGVYFVSRFWLSPTASLGTAIIMAILPEIAFWGRQVMLDIPVYAFVMWSVYFLIGYTRNFKISMLYLSIALLVLAAYIKTPIVFLALPYLITLIQYRGVDLFKDKNSYIITLLAFVGMLPLIIMTLQFGQVNIQAVVDSPDTEATRYSIQGWIYYLLEMPGMLGWPALIAVLSGIITFLVWNDHKKQSLKNGLFLISWFIIGYLFYSSIDLKAARFSIHILFPLILLIGLASDMIEQKKQWAGKLFIMVVAIMTLGLTMKTRPVDYVHGYKEIAEFVTSQTPKNSNILFSGYRDGAFIFNMRAHSQRPDISIIRADKLLLKVASRRELGVEQQEYTKEEISNLIDSLAIHYVVAQPDFWIDLEQMNLLQSLLKSDRFEEVKTFHMDTNFNAQDKKIIVYRNLGNIAEGPVNIQNELPIIGKTISIDTPDNDDK